jgi:hypothetical protein
VIFLAVLRCCRAGSKPALFKQVSAGPSECRPRLSAMPRHPHTQGVHCRPLPDFSKLGLKLRLSEPPATHQQERSL